MPLRSLFVDFNAFFASAEQQLRPELRGRPVAVMPVASDATSCIAASYEAKRFGVKTGTRVSDARKMCPGITLVEARPDLYIELHHSLIRAVDSVLPVGQVLSIDEMTCPLLGRWQEPEVARETALAVKRAVAKVGEVLRCSIGIGPNSFLAKTASDMQKPDGLVVLLESDLPDRLFGLELRDLCGIGANMEVRLHRHGILSMRHLLLASKEKLRQAWGGIEGERFHALLRGEDFVRAETNRSTVGHSHVLEPEFRSYPKAEAVLHRLLQKAAARLRKLGYLAGALTVQVKFLEQARWSEEMQFLETQETLDFIRVFNLLWQRRPREVPAPLKVGVVLSKLSAMENTTCALPGLRTSRPALDNALDALNLSFGKNTIWYGGAQTALKSAPTRIAFTNIPEVEKERKLLRSEPENVTDW